MRAFVRGKFNCLFALQSNADLINDIVRRETHMQPIYEFGGEGQIINFALANGFPQQTYIPLLQPLTEQYRVVSLLPRPLWSGESVPPKKQDWRKLFGQDLINALNAYDLHDVILVGHSFGGIASIIAAASVPERVKGLILLDPTIMSPSFFWFLWGVQLLGLETPLAKRALKRQIHFDSAESAYEKFKPKRLFADWSDEAVRHYAESMIPDGDQVTLAWSREWEAYVFDTIYTGIWRILPKLRGKMPILVVRGDESDTFLESSAKKVQRILPEATYKEIVGHGHLFPHSAPDQTRDIMMEWLGTL